MAETRATINERLKRVSIKGKPYVEVAQRVTGFWEIFPNGAIKTDWLLLEPDQCVCQATVYDGDKILAQGTAWEVKKGNINTTSYVENCETSAIGRALGNAGIGSVESIASADEVAHAMAQQAEPAPKPKQEEPANDEGIAHRNMVAAYNKAKEFGFSDEDLRLMLDEVIPGKRSKDYTVMDKVKATNVLTGLIQRGDDPIE